MKFILFILLSLTFLNLQAQNKQSKGKHLLPVYIFIPKEQYNYRLVKALSDSLKVYGFKVIDEEEHDRLLKISFSRMFELAAEDKAKGLDPDPARLNKRLPSVFQVLALEFETIQETADWTISPLRIRTYRYPATEKAFIQDFGPEKTTNKLLVFIVSNIVESCISTLK